jgi:hypothetical protein
MGTYECNEPVVQPAIAFLFKKQAIWPLSQMAFYLK